MSGVFGMFCLNLFICQHIILFSSPAKFPRKCHIQYVLHAECGVVPFNQLCSGNRNRAFPLRFPVTKWSGYKTSIVLDILALFYSYILTRPWVLKLGRRLAGGSGPLGLASLYMCRHLTRRQLLIVQRVCYQSSATVGMQLQLGIV